MTTTITFDSSRYRVEVIRKFNPVEWRRLTRKPLNERTPEDHKLLEQWRELARRFFAPSAEAAAPAP
jgi:hypothetical protein